MPCPASDITGLAFNVWPFWYPFLGCFRITSTQSCSNRNVSRSQYILLWKLTVKNVILSVRPLPAASGGCRRKRLERHGCRSIRWKAELVFPTTIVIRAWIHHRALVLLTNRVSLRTLLPTCQLLFAPHLGFLLMESNRSLRPKSSLRLGTDPLRTPWCPSDAMMSSYCVKWVSNERQVGWFVWSDLTTEPSVSQCSPPPLEHASISRWPLLVSLPVLVYKIHDLLSSSALAKTAFLWMFGIATYQEQKVLQGDYMRRASVIQP